MIKCKICQSKKLHYSFTLESARVVKCVDCHALMIDPQSKSDINTNQSLIGYDENSILKDGDAKYLLNELLLKENNLYEKKLLQIGFESDEFLSQAAKFGVKVFGIPVPGKLNNNFDTLIKKNDIKIIKLDINDIDKNLNENEFDYIVITDVLTQILDPVLLIKNVYKHLKKDGKILVTIQSLDSRSARIQKLNWKGFNARNLFYFDIKNLRSILHQNGFNNIRKVPPGKAGHLDCINYLQTQKRENRLLYLYKLIKFIFTKNSSLESSKISLIANKKNDPEIIILSVIMPVFNEIKTLKSTVQKVLNKKIDGVIIELIIVESASTDGSREYLKELKNDKVHVIYQDSPRGKGNAVREGLTFSKGDFILIQDADDEYDIEDYNSLVGALIDGRESFVLGARHGAGGWKIRKFTDQPLRAYVLNIGHIFFASLLNFANGVNLKDPFTMYKVFRRDCLLGLHFECDRFDFDHELVIKLIRAGFKPQEIAVNYRSRSFAEGKKVTMIGDPLSWLLAILKYSYFSSGRK